MFRIDHLIPAVESLDQADIPDQSRSAHVNISSYEKQTNKHMCGICDDHIIDALGTQL